MEKLSRTFYSNKTLEVAKSLLGMLLIRQINNKKLICRITEVEAYIGNIDKACHAFGGRKTKRTQIMFEAPGYAYIYLIYGMYHCLNFVTEPKGEPSAILIRGAEPVDNIEEMSLYRYGKTYKELNSYQKNNFMNGPGKLCKALNITKKLNGADLLGEELYVCTDETSQKHKIKEGKRINIDYAEEAKDFLWRFYI
ncbi:MAG: DNA-3-methyladenine glycosylase [Eubacteriales bacterium]